MGIADYIKTRLPYWPNWLNHLLLKWNVFGGLVYGRAYRSILKNIDKGNPEKTLVDMVNFAIERVPYYKE